MHIRYSMLPSAAAQKRRAIILTKYLIIPAFTICLAMVVHKTIFPEKTFDDNQKVELLGKMRTAVPAKF